MVCRKNEEMVPEYAVPESLFAGTLTDPHSVLGIHDWNGSQKIIRVYDPMAVSVELLTGKDFLRSTLMKPEGNGIFTATVKRKTFFPYRLKKTFADGSSFESADPYSFLPGIGEMDLYLFNSGDHRNVYDMMGAHCRTRDGVDGVEFTVWAPNAAGVSVVGDFNCWDGRRHMMRLMGNSGIWELFIPSLCAGDLYKFEIRTQSGETLTKLDPYARQTELRPGNAGIVLGKDSFDWNDVAWMEQRRSVNPMDLPANIYEVHLGSWRNPELGALPEGSDFHNYREIARVLGEYVLKMGYTHVELLPICEHPLDQSWGYQVSGFYSPTSRYGSPEDFAYFVDHMHQLGIGVILDWVPAHFPKDAFSLGRFDGTALYEHADPRQGEHRDWGTYIFNYGRCEVRNFLIGSALYWLDRYHIDGLRVDAVASMLYLDYSRNAGDWIPNQYGGNENLESVAFLRKLNELTNELFPGTVMIAEESTSWPGVSKPVYLGGLGFTYKWNMGWMHDTLEYFKLDPVYRSYNHGKLTFSLQYAFSENFILPLSHDEVVHGKCSLLNKMPGDYQQKFANLRALYAYMATHPGKKILFMGGEFAQWIEWNCNAALDWNLLEYPQHKAMQNLVRDLNFLYREETALWSDDFSPAGFQWLDGGDVHQSVVSYIRWDKQRKEPVVIILNLTPVVRDHYTTGVPLPGDWVEILNTDAECYGGTNLLNEGVYSSEPGLYHGQDQHITLRLPWLGAVILKKRK